MTNNCFISKLNNPRFAVALSTRDLINIPFSPTYITGIDSITELMFSDLMYHLVDDL
jgi:hypothetical protein